MTMFFQYSSLFFFLLLASASAAAGGQVDECNTSFSKCKHGPPIRFPFRLKGDNLEHCGLKEFQVFCDEKNQTMIELSNSVKMVVKKIDYKSRRIHLQDPQKCLPNQLHNLNLSTSPFNYLTTQVDDFVFFNCSSGNRDFNTYSPLPCLDDIAGAGYRYALTNTSSYSDLTFCTPFLTIPPVPEDVFQDQKNLELAWKHPNCTECESKGKFCRPKDPNYTYKAMKSPGFQPRCLEPKKHQGPFKILLIAGSVFGTILFVVLVIAVYHGYTWYKIYKEEQIKVDKFLEDYKAMKPTRYSFADIKNITNRFSDKLGEGAYGMVFKGKLSREIFVAVKVLNGPIGNGDEFINEVKTMGTIHHVNVIRMVGFCADGGKRALVYEFLPNESLEKLILSGNKNRSLQDWAKLHEIAIGTAKGLEYLHQGCDHRILHFDIKPHNVLLDENLVPKIADFGLAKLCSKDQSIVSMSAARGTVGYIAPEVFSRNFGNVSYKSDVYSFGMLLLEIVGGRKNIDAMVENSNQAYFPEWIYKRLINEEDENETNLEENEDLIGKTLTIVGLWCIQMRPTDRPSMKTVVQMLQVKEKALAMPPNPFASKMEDRSSTKPTDGFNTDLAVIVEEE